MIKLFFGNTLDGCTDAILQSLTKRERGRQALILAPDSFSFALESKVADIQADLNVEVMTFARLAMRVLGGKIKKCLTPEGCTMLMTKALFQCRDSLNCYKASLNRKGFVSEMYSSVTALRSSGISAERLAEAARQMRGYTALKTADLAVIYNTYMALLNGNYTDPTTRLEALCAEIPHSQFIREADLYIVDFYAFNHKQYEVLDKLMRCSHSLSIGCIDCVGGLSNRAVYPYETTAVIKQLAMAAGVPVQRENAFERLGGFAEAVCNKLYDLSPTLPQKADISLSLLCPPSPKDEADEVCREIARLVRGGMRYKDISVVCGDEADPTLESTFNDYSLPYFKDVKSSLSEEPSVRFLLGAIDLVCSRCELNQVMSFVRNPLFAEKDSDIMIFDNYCLKYAINYSRFTAPFEVGLPEERRIPEGIRASLCSIMPVLPEKGEVKDFVEAVREYLHRAQFDSRLGMFYQRQCDCNEQAAAKRTAQVPMRLTTALDTMCELLHDFQVSAVEFRELLFGCLDGVKLSLIPLLADCVHIGAARDCKFEETKVMFITGASGGNIPREVQDGSILSSKFHTELQLLDMVLRPAVKEENRYSRFCLTQLLIKPTQALIISCPEKGGDGARLSPSEIFSMLSKLFEVTVISSLEHTMPQKAVTQKECAGLIAYGLAHLRSEQEYECYCGLYSLLSDNLRDKINAVYATRNDAITDGSIFYSDGYTSVSRMESFFSCPYSFFLKYGLRARERDLGEIQVNEAGTFIHAVLESFIGEYGAVLDRLSYEQALSKAYHLGSELLKNDYRLSALFKSENPRRMENLCSEAAIISAELSELIKRGDFRPMGVEVAFGDGKNCKFPSVTLPGGTRVRGKIDRIDCCGNDVAVIDYKSGNIEAKLQSVFYGEKIQLYIYLYALRQQGYHPIAAFYQHIASAYAGEVKSKTAYCYLGQFINESSLIDKFDHGFAQSGSSPVLPIRFDGKSVKTVAGLGVTNAGSLLSEQELTDIIDYSYRLLVLGDSQIKNGYIAVSPIAGKCRYCKGKNVCGYNGEGRRLYAKNTADFKK